ncbi:transposase domain-containing protein [Chondrinema litorale]|uniref:transposase domain-containing protein n=1 Tax=Chondrinema litorale TaxID=2994555 RepID=UPI002543D807|nr:transposase domain-containing protein [Chondrinema litorale]UZR96301.1 transposase domain-containing protein [Chondrinema litorale]
MIENNIRPVAIGRKNYLFAGSHESAQRAAMMYSILGSCKLHQINPYEYLQDIFERLPEHPINKINELLPQNWKTTS